MLLSRLVHLPRALRQARHFGRAVSPTEIASILSKPSWSVASLLPTGPDPADTTITSEKLHHLLRLSALAPPATTTAETSLIKSLHEHLHFMRSAQAVDTTGVSQLARIEDEVDRETIRWEDVSAEDDERVGGMGREQWDPMALPKRKVAGFYVVDEKVTEELDIENDSIPFI